MPAPHVVILNSGGLRSLVATALTLQPGERLRATLLHVVDGRENGMVRAEHVRLQAEAYGITRVAELDLPHLYGHGADLAGDGRATGVLVAPQLLLAALGHARHHAAERVVFPCSFNGELGPMARATEQAVLCGHLADLAGDAMPTLDTPLLEYTDQQLVELGAQLGVNWGLAWSCQARGSTPCRNCAACRRRAAAFDKAGLLDPAASPAPAAALTRRR